MSGGSKKRKRNESKKPKIEQSQKHVSQVSQSLLSSYYPLVLSLREYLSLVLPLSDPHQIFPPIASNTQPEKRFLRLADSLVAVDEAEAQALISLRAGNSLDKGKWSNWKPPAPDSAEYDPATLLQLVRVAQTVLMKQKTKGQRNNMLILGYEVSKGDSVVSVGSYLSNFFPNTHVAYLSTSSEWARLLRSVGSSVFQHLITRCSIFLPLPGTVDCWSQLCGQPLSDPSLKPRPLPKNSKQVSSSSSSISALSEAAGASSKRKRGDAVAQSIRQSSPPASDLNTEKTKSVPSARVATAPGPIATLKRNGAESSKSALPNSPSAVARVSKAISPTNISVVRSRIFYGKPNRRNRLITAGYPSAHVFQSSLEQVKTAGLPSELPLTDSRSVARRTLHTLKHIWPKEYKLKNVWKEQPPTGKNKIISPIAFVSHKDREGELKARSSIRMPNQNNSMKTPKRLKEVVPLISLMLEKQDKFDYRKALSLCCPSRVEKKGHLTQKDRMELASKVEEEIDARAAPTQSLATQHVAERERKPISDRRSLTLRQSIQRKVRRQAREQPRFAQFMIPSGQVSRFAKMVFSGIVPKELMGSEFNYSLLKKRIGRFVVARRYETFNIHELMQDIRLCDFDWAIPSNTRAQNQRSTPAEHQKRKSLVSELIYWIFDSLLIPLLKTTFYVTEAAAFNYQVLYFRQDDWAKVTGPLQSKYTNGPASLFRPISNEEAGSILESRRLQYSTIRLLPKETGVRPIINLGRRIKKKVEPLQQNRFRLQPAYAKTHFAEMPSVNQLLKPSFDILTFEKKDKSELLGSSVFGPDDIFPRLKKYKESLPLDSKGRLPPLYFVKVDVRKAFDTIVHDKLLEIIKNLMQHDSYIVHSHSRVMSHSESDKKKVVKKEAAKPGFGRSFQDSAAEMARTLRHVVFVDNVVYSVEEKDQAMATLCEHIKGNLIKIGRNFFQQHTGIAQGSKVSTLLCCYFYADLERNRLAFTNKRESLLMRYTDDFLFVTSNISDARRFFNVMSKGHPDYGCYVSAEKSLLNFNAVTSDGKFVPRIQGNGFLWAGHLINTQNLSVAQNLGRYAFTNIADSQNVRSGSRPGSAFRSKLRDEIRRRSHIIYTDKQLNSDSSTYSNIYQTFILVAMKFHAYLKALGFDPRVGTKFCEESIQDLVLYAYRHLTSHSQGSKVLLRKDCVTWIGYHAFYSVLSPKRSHYGSALRMLSSRMNAPGRSGARKKVGRVAKMAWVKNAGLVKGVKY